MKEQYEFGSYFVVLDDSTLSFSVAETGPVEPWSRRVYVDNGQLMLLYTRALHASTSAPTEVRERLSSTRSCMWTARNDWHESGRCKDSALLHVRTAPPLVGEGQSDPSGRVDR